MLPSVSRSTVASACELGIFLRLKSDSYLTLEYGHDGNNMDAICSTKSKRNDSIRIQVLPRKLISYLSAKLASASVIYGSTASPAPQKAGSRTAAFAEQATAHTQRAARPLLPAAH